MLHGEHFLHNDYLGLGDLCQQLLLVSASTSRRCHNQMQAVIRVFSTFGVHSHLKCFSGQSSSQKSSQLILASHSPHLQPPPPLRSPFFLPCPSSGEVRFLGEVTGTLFFLLSVFHSALLVLSSPPRPALSEDTPSGRVVPLLTYHSLPTSGW